VPVAPGRFSTITCCPSESDTSGASSRDSTSIEPPAPNGISTRIGLVGHGSAARPPRAGTAVAMTPLAVAANSFRRVSRSSIFPPFIFTASMKPAPQVGVNEH
jgi:hypothetical protein